MDNGGTRKGSFAASNEIFEDDAPQLRRKDIAAVETEQHDSERDKIVGNIGQRGRPIKRP